MRFQGAYRKILRTLTLFFCLAAFPVAASAQKVSFGTDAMQWANFGTLNAEFSVRVSQHFSMNFGGRYNPWNFHTRSGFLMHNQQTTGYLSLRYWPKQTFSRWWDRSVEARSGAGLENGWRPFVRIHPEDP